MDDERWSTKAAFGDYNRDGFLDLFVANYVDFKLSDLPQFGHGKFCEYRGMPVQCGPRGLPGGGDSLFRNNGNGTFSDVSVKAGVADPDRRYGLGVVWPDGRVERVERVPANCFLTVEESRGVTRRVSLSHVALPAT